MLDIESEQVRPRRRSDERSVRYKTKVTAEVGFTPQQPDYTWHYRPYCSVGDPDATREQPSVPIGRSEEAHKPVAKDEERAGACDKDEPADSEPSSGGNQGIWAQEVY